MKQATDNLINLPNPVGGVKLTAIEHSVKRIKPFQYPIRNSILLEVKQPTTIDPSIREAVLLFLQDRMASRNQTEAVLVCSTRDRIPMSRRKDRTASAPIVEAKIVITSTNDIPRAVDTLFQKLNSLKERITIDGLKAVIGLGTLNTLEVLSEPGEEDSFRGF